MRQIDEIKDVQNAPARYVDATGDGMTGKLTVERNNDQINAKRGNNIAVMTTSATDGEYLFGGRSTSFNSDFIENYIRIGKNKLQYSYGQGMFDIYHKGNKPTPAEIGALNKNGDNINGDLEIAYPHKLITSHNYGVAGKMSNGQSDYLIFMDTADRVHVGWHGRSIMIDDDAPVTHSGHRFYHQGFKPTLSELNAVNRSGDSDICKLSFRDTGKIDDCSLTVMGPNSGGKPCGSIDTFRGIKISHAAAGSVLIGGIRGERYDDYFTVLTTQNNSSDYNEVLRIGSNGNIIKYKGNRIWHEGNDGSGSGLDADLLDGLQSNDFLRSTETSELKYGSCIGIEHVASDNTRFNPKTRVGICGGRDSASATDCNLRLYSWYGIGLVNTIADQVVPQYENATWFNVRQGTIYTRGEIYAKTDKKVWHEGNHGHGSGLDADKIDGQHLSDLDNRFVNATGDTINGYLNIQAPNANICVISEQAKFRAVSNNLDGSVYLQAGINDTNHYGNLILSGMNANNLNYFQIKINNLSNAKINDNKILTTADYGHTKRLDADTLDGKHATDFATANHNHDDLYFRKGCWNTNGNQDLLVHGKRALVGFDNANGNDLHLNYGNDFAAGVFSHGNFEVQGDYITVKSNNKSTSLGVGSNDTYVCNSVSNKYLQLKNDGTLSYSNRKIQLEPQKEPLWQGATYLSKDMNIKPSKPISECQNGWMLVFSDYDPGKGPNNFNWYTHLVPKNSKLVNSGGNVLFMVPDHENGDWTIKSCCIYDKEIRGDSLETVTDWNDVVLREVLEY